MFQRRKIQLASALVVVILLFAFALSSFVPALAQSGGTSRMDECLVYLSDDAPASMRTDDDYDDDDYDDDEYDDDDVLNEACPLLDDVTVTLDEAIAIAEAEFGSVAMRVELERERSGLHYTVLLEDRSEVEVDATTGDILEFERGDSDDADDRPNNRRGARFDD